MKIQYKNIKTCAIAALASVALFSCSEDTMDTINQDVDNPHDVEAKFILTDVITSTAFKNVGGDFNHYFSTYVEHEVGIYNQLYNAEHRGGEVYSSSTFDNDWKNMYETLKNARIVVDKCSDGNSEAGNYTTKGIGEVLEALNAGIIADGWGDTPYSQAALPNLVNGQPAYLNPVIDKQEDIYKNIIALLDAGIADLPKGDKNGPGSQDVLYKGDAAKWLKLAYGLKARYTMHTLNVAADKTAALKTVIECCEKSFQSADEQAAFGNGIYDGSTNLNPSYDFFTSREYLAASHSLAKKLVDYADPRAHCAFTTALDPAADYTCTQVDLTETDADGNSPMDMTAPNGTAEQAQEYYNTSIFPFAPSAPTFLQSYHEIKFLEAEALYRLGDNAGALTALKEAVAAGLQNAGSNIENAFTSGMVNEGSHPAITDDDISTYLTKVEERFAENPLKEIMIQKYFAFWGSNGESTECYNDVRRLKAEGHFDYYGLENPANAKNKFPERVPYGASGVTGNPNIQTAYGNGQYIFSEPVWWAGGKK